MNPPTTTTTTTRALDVGLPAATGAPPVPVENFHHYQVLRRPEDGSLWELGRGAMGVTYKAFDVNLRCPVALKVVSPHALADETTRARFVREARAAARLRHPNVASVYHLGQDGQSFFYAMEFVDGETLEALVRRDGPRPAGLALRLAIQVARALGVANREGLVHRDIKPANLMVVRDEDEEGGLQLKVIDFGLARVALGAAATGGQPVGAASATGAGGLSALTHAGFVGTPLFASPEQLEEHEVDIRSDIYSLGVTLWYLLTGSAPFTGSLAGIISQHLTREPPWEKLDELGRFNAAATAGAPPLRALLERLLAKDREARPADPVALRRELEEALRALPPSAADPTVADGVSFLPLRPNSRRLLPATEAPLASRYELVRPVGEGSAGRVFLARDLAPGSGGRTLVALKMLHADLLVTPADESGLADLVRRVRAAGHLNLLETFSLERDGGHHFLVQEWLRGFNLIALLRSRGALAAPDVFPLLEGAGAALDQAHAAGLPVRRLELGLHQVVVHFPDGENSVELFPVPSGPLTGWPAFQVKVDPLGIGREAVGGDPLLTWTGDQTLIPTALPARRLTRDTQSGLIREAAEAGGQNGDDDLAAGLRALGLLGYSLLGGSAAALAAEVGGSPARYVNLPALSERANVALRRACLPTGGVAEFRSAGEFLTALRGGSAVAATMPLPRSAPPSTAGPKAVAAELPPPPRLTVSQPNLTRRAVVGKVGSSSAPPVPALTTPSAMARTRTRRPVHEENSDDEAALETSHSIAYLIDPPPRSGGGPPVLVALLALIALVGLLAAGGWWFGTRFLGFGVVNRGAPSSTANGRTVVARPPALPERRTPTAAALPEKKPASTPPPLARAPVPSQDALTGSVPPVLRRSPEPAFSPVERRESPPVNRLTPVVAATPLPSPAAPVSSAGGGPLPGRRVRVNLFSEPSGAELTLGDQSLGVAPQTVTLPPGEYAVRARYGDWPEAGRTIRVPTEGVDSMDARIKLVPRATAPGNPAVGGPEGFLPAPGEAGSAPSPGRGRATGTGEIIASPESQALPAIPVPQEPPPGDGT